MGTSHQTLLEQQKITGREIRRRKEFFGFTREHVDTLRQALPLVEENVERIVDQFYRHILSFSEIDRLIGDAETLKKLRNHQRMYTLSLFQGVYDEEYVHGRLRIGIVHKRIGVDPKLYVSAIQNLGEVLKRFIIDDGEADVDTIMQLFSAIDKLLLFDLSLVFDTYIHSLMDELQRSKQELEEYTQSLEQIVNERTDLLQKQARTDGLTGLLNQTHFYEELQRELARGQRRGHTTSLLYCDLDEFKNLNDNKGHQMGDMVLKEFAHALNQSIRAGEWVARYGGDEFCVIVPEGGLEEAESLAGRIIDIARDRMGRYGISCSIGIAVSGPDDFLDCATMVKKADKAMYAAKLVEGFSVKFSG